MRVLLKYQTGSVSAKQLQSKSRQKCRSVSVLPGVVHGPTELWKPGWVGTQPLECKICGLVTVLGAVPVLQWSRTPCRPPLCPRLCTKWSRTAWSSHVTHPRRRCSTATCRWPGSGSGAARSQWRSSPWAATLCCSRAATMRRGRAWGRCAWTSWGAPPSASPSSTCSPLTRASSTARPLSGSRTRTARGTPWPGSVLRGPWSTSSPPVSLSGGRWCRLLWRLCKDSGSLGARYPKPWSSLTVLSQPLSPAGLQIRADSCWCCFSWAGGRRTVGTQSTGFGWRVWLCRRGDAGSA